MQQQTTTGEDIIQTTQDGQAKGTVKDLERWTVTPYTAVPDFKIEGLDRTRIMTFELLAMPGGGTLAHLYTIGYGCILASERVVVERIDRVIEHFLDVTHMWHILEIRARQLSEIYTMHTRVFPKITISHRERKSSTLSLLAVGVEMPSGKVIVESAGDIRMYSDIQQLGQRYLNDPRIVIQEEEQ